MRRCFDAGWHRRSTFTPLHAEVKFDAYQYPSGVAALCNLRRHVSSTQCDSACSSLAGPTPLQGCLLSGLPSTVYTASCSPPRPSNSCSLRTQEVRPPTASPPVRRRASFGLLPCYAAHGRILTTAGSCDPPNPFSLAHGRGDPLRRRGHNPEEPPRRQLPSNA